MPWPPENDSEPQPDAGHQHQPNQHPAAATSSAPRGWDSCLSVTDWSAWFELRTIIPTTVLTTSILLAFRLNRCLRRFPDAVSIPSSYFRRKSVFGQVTSVGDGDNFRLYHTPGGRLAGWGWLPWKKVPTAKRELKDNTIHIRLAGIDAPELSHFGRPEQPFAREAHEWLTSYLLNRRVRAYVHRQDQYQRAVGSVYVRRALDFPFPFRKRDVSYEMLRSGLATVYEAKTGSEFGGETLERKYRKAEWWAKLRGTGLWKHYRKNGKDWESPREYKTRMGLAEQGQERK